MTEEDHDSDEAGPHDALFGEDPLIERAIRSAVSNGLPSASLALYARWWQLETWLRELAYVELRALDGQAWKDRVKVGFGRQEQDAAYRHMMSPDTENPLAYLDYSQLIQVMQSNWDQFEFALLSRASWEGRQDELKRIRHRIGHLRQSHPDDLNRLDQILRDLERGTYVALASYNKRHIPDPKKNSDPITVGWLREEHPAARRLIRHAEGQYDTTLHISASRRPWTSWPLDLTGASGVLWHCDFFMRGRTVDARRLWHDDQLTPTRHYLVHMLAHDPSHIGFTFAAADDAVILSDVIGDTFDAILGASRSKDRGSEDWDAWSRRIKSVDFRLLNRSGWNIVSDDTLPISNFGSGGGVEAAPAW